MSTIASIGLSGMQAAEARLEAAASNIANAQTNGRVPSASGPAAGDVYQPIDVVQVDQSSGGQPGGVTTSYVVRPNAYSLVYDPNSPVADGKGMVAAPEVDLASELVSVIIAKYQFAASAKIVQADSDMQKSAIDTLA